MFRTTAIILATLLATACTAPDGGGPSAPCEGKCDGDSSPTIRFAEDYTQTVSGDLVAGGRVRIDYDLDRLPLCRGSSNGSEVWGVTGYVQYDDAAPETFALSRLDGGRVVPIVATLDIPAGASRITTWFSSSNRWGCIAYDSDYGANYGWDLDPGADSGQVVLDFAADGSMSQTDAVAAGASLVVHYDPSRLETCAGSSGGHAAWGITGHWQVDQGPVHDLMVTRADGSTLVAADPAFTVPAGRDLALWFEATSVWGCHAYDSAGGANYHVAIE